MKSIRRQKTLLRSTYKPQIESLEARLCLAASFGWDGPELGAAELSYYVGTVPASVGLDQADVESALETALSAWSAVADIQFTRTAQAGQPDSLDITFAALDGRGDILAQAYLPDDVNRGPLAGDIQFDLADPWEIGNEEGRSAFDLVYVASHEIGHALGLDHIDDADSVLQPNVSPNQSFSSLSDADVDAILSLYAPANTGVADSDNSGETDSNDDDMTDDDAGQNRPGRRGHDRVWRRRGWSRRGLSDAAATNYETTNAAGENTQVAIDDSNQLGPGAANNVSDDDEALDDVAIDTPEDDATGDMEQEFGGDSDGQTEDGLVIDRFVCSIPRNGLLKRLDVNEDGTLTQDELSSAAWKRLRRGDTNADEAISADELTALRIAKRDLVIRFDQDNDGQLTEDEGPSRVWARTAVSNTNDDSVISQDEFDRFAHRHHRRTSAPRRN